RNSQPDEEGKQEQPQRLDQQRHQAPPSVTTKLTRTPAAPPASTAVVTAPAGTPAATSASRTRTARSRAIARWAIAPPLLWPRTSTAYVPHERSAAATSAMSRRDGGLSQALPARNCIARPASAVSTICPQEALAVPVRSGA